MPPLFKCLSSSSSTSKSLKFLQTSFKYRPLSVLTTLFLPHYCKIASCVVAAPMTGRPCGLIAVAPRFHCRYDHLDLAVSQSLTADQPIRGDSYMTSAKFLDFLDPLPPLSLSHSSNLSVLLSHFDQPPSLPLSADVI